LTKEFVRIVCLRRGVPPEYADSAGGAVFTYGSYKLGVNSAGMSIIFFFYQYI
jgi:poly(A) polymerase